jgi:Esterase-like activity of phytase
VKSREAQRLVRSYGVLRVGIALLACVTPFAPPVLAAPDSTVIAVASSVADPPIQISFLDRYEFLSKEAPRADRTAEELSGLARIDDEHFFAIGDAHACLHRLNVRIDRASGKILSAKLDRPLLLLDGKGHPYDDSKDGKDREGVIFDPRSRAVWISNEQTEGDRHHSCIEQHRLSDGRLLALIRWDSDPMLRVFEHGRRNRGWESLARNEAGTEIWTGNEEALEVDGPASTDHQGGVIRLQKFDGAMHPIAQYAYVLDPYPAKIRGPLFLLGHEIAGLSELLVLPGGRLIALERAFAGLVTGEAGLRSRIYLIDFTGATDVSKGDLAGGLDGRKSTPVGKTLLWSRDWGVTNSNFEGMALGPRLADGDRVLLLVADNNGGTSQTLVTLRVRGLPR